MKFSHRGAGSAPGFGWRSAARSVGGGDHFVAPLHRKFLPPLVCALALLSGCTGSDDAAWTPPLLPSVSAVPSPGAEVPWWESLTADTLPTALATPETLVALDDEEVALLGRIGEIALYGLGGDSGVLLSRDGALSHFDQSFATPDAAALPVLYSGDYDADGEDELAVRYLMEASEDKVVYDLSLYDWTEGVATVCPVTQAACAELALDEVTTDYDQTAGTITLSYGRSSAVYHLLEGQVGGKPVLDTGFFRETDGGFTVVLGVRMDMPGSLFANILADIAYDGESFTLQNIKVEPTTGV